VVSRDIGQARAVEALFLCFDIEVGHIERPVTHLRGEMVCYRLNRNVLLKLEVNEWRFTRFTPAILNDRARLHPRQSEGGGLQVEPAGLSDRAVEDVARP